MNGRVTFLLVAVVLVMGQTIAEAVSVATRHDLTSALRVALIAVLSLQLVFARGVLRRSPGSVFALLAFELTALVAAAGASYSIGARILLAISAVAVIGSLFAALPAFPTRSLPATGHRS